MSNSGHLPELESLRSQVADLARALAEQDHSSRAHAQHLEQTMQDFREQSHLLRTIIEGTAAETGDAFFASLVTRLTSALNVQFAIVGEVVGNETESLRTLAVSAGGTLVDNFEYALEHAPCGTGLAQPFWCFEQGVQARFPNFPNLATLGVDSHCGVALRTKTGEVVGLLIVMDTKPLRNSEHLRSLLEVFAARATAELLRHRAELARRDSEQRLRFAQFALDHAVEAVLWADNSMRFIYANEAACRSLGYAQNELLTLRIPDIVPHHNADRFQDRLDQIRQGEAAIYESVHRRKDGTEFPIEVSVTCLTHNGQDYTCATFRDITDRTRIQQERLEALSALQNIMETVPDIMFTLDTQGNLVRWNNRVVTVTNYTQEELLNKSALAFVPDQERTNTAEAIQRAFTEGYAELEGHLLTKQGHTIPYHWTGAALRDLSGRLIGITGIARDVSESKRAQSEQARQRQHLVEAQALAHLGSWEWDIESGEVQWSNELFRIFGHEPGSITVTYDTFLATLLPDDHDRTLAAINQALTGPAAYDIEYRIVRPDGVVRVVHARGDVQRNAAGHPLSIAGTVLDITDRTQIEAALSERARLAEFAAEISLAVNQDQSVADLLDGCIAMTRQHLGVAFARIWTFESDDACRSCEKADACTDQTPCPSLHLHDSFSVRLHEEPFQALWGALKIGRIAQELDTVWTNDVLHDDRLPDKHWMQENRLCSFAGIPLVVENRVFGIFGIFGTTPLSKPTVNALESASHGMAAAIARKLMAEDLRRSKAQLSDIMENNPAVVYARHIGDEWPFTFVTPNVFGLLGYTSIDLISNAGLWGSLMHPDDLAEFIAQALPSFLRKGTETFVARLRHRNGQYRWIENQARLTQLGDGPLVMVGTMTDISERMQTETALRESEARNRAILESALDAVISIDAHSHIIGWNPQAEVMFGYAAHEVQGRPLDQTIIPPRYRQAHAHGMNRILQSGDGASVKRRFEFFALHRNGQEFPVEFAIASTQIDGRPAFSAFIRDTTERTQAEAALRESEERYRALIEVSPAGVFVFCEGRTVFVNSMAVTLLGATSPNDILDRSPFDFIDPDYHKDVTRNLRRVLAGEATVHRAERIYLKLDGTPIYVQVEAVRMTWKGKPAIQGFFSDITERKRVEQALQRSERQLRTVLDTLPIGVWFTDANGQVLYGNPVGQQIWAGAARVGLPQPSGDQLWWETIEKTETPHRWAVGTVLARGQDQPNELLEIETTTGDRRTIRNSAVPVKSDTGEVLGAIVLNEDITGRIRTEQALRQEHALLVAVMDAAIDVIYVKDCDGRYVHMNRAGAQALRMPVEDVVGWDDYGLWPSDLARSCRATDKQVLETGDTLTVEETSTTDGRTSVYLTNKAPYRDPEGRMIGIIGVSRDITERKRAEEALRASEERFAKAFRSSPSPIIISELESGLLIDANETAFKIGGYQREDVVNRTSLELQLWPTADHRKRFVDQLIETGAIRNLAIDLRMRSGELRHCLISAEQIELDGKRCMVTVGTDITEQKRAEEALREKHALLSAVMDTAMDIIFVKDLNGRYLHMNPAGARVVGMTVEEVVGKGDDDIWPPDLVATCKAADQLVISSGTAQTFEESTVIDGNRITYLSTKAPYRDAAGQLIGIIGVAHDITGIKQSENRLRQSHAFIRQIIDTDPNFIFAKDRDGRFTLVNKAVADAYGTTVDELIGKTDADFNGNAKEVSFFLRKDQEVLDHHREQFIPEECITDATGTIRWLQTVKRPILDEAGQVSMVLGASTDITERKRMEEALRQRERDLRTAIDERERISQDLHDGILQSLYAVGLGLEACKPLMTQQRYKKATATMDQAIGQLNYVMRDVRNFIAGLESQVIEGSTFPAALHTMVQTLAAAHPLRYTITVDKTAATYISTEQALHLLNIVREALSNSLRHAHATSATVSLKPLARSIRLSISDNGIGFDPASMRGVGYGLANMAARAKRIGGRFAIKSVPQHGTRITIDLPREPRHA